VFLKRHQNGDEHGTTLEVLLVEHLSVLTDRAGRRLTLREQTYVGDRPSEHVAKTLRAETAARKHRIH